MPSWKKVITSGSDAVLNSVIATGSLDTINRELIYNDQTVLDWDLHQLAANGVTSVEWDDRTLYDKSAEVSIDWDRRQLKGLDLNVMLDWSGSALQASASIYMSASTQLYGTASYAVTASSVDVVDFGSPLGPYAAVYKVPFVRTSGSGQTLFVDNDLIYNGYYNILFVTSSHTATASLALRAISSSYALTASYVAGVSTPTLQQVTTQGNTTTNNVIISGSLFVSNSIDTSQRYLLDNVNVASIDWSNRWLTNDQSNPVVQWNLGELTRPNDEVTVNWFNRYLRSDDGAHSVDWENKALRQQDGLYVHTSINWASRSLYDTNEKAVLYWSGSDQLILSASNLYAKGLVTSSTSNVLTYDTSTGQIYYTASSAIGGGGSSGPETDPVFTAWSGSVTSQFAGTSSFALTASLAPNYVLNTATSSFVLNSQTSSMTVLSSSFALTASYVQTALTASFITGSNVFGPFGSNSIRSASYAVTASHVPGLSPGGPTYAVQFNNEGAFDGKEAFSFNPDSSSLVMGNGAVASGYYATALGFNTVASRTGSLASGFYAAATDNYASAFGDQTDATGYASFANGIGTLATKSASFATGNGTLARGNFSSAHGLQTQTDADASFVVGKYNKVYFNNTGGSGSFVVGNGTDGGNRRNYFEVMPELGYVSASGNFYNKEDVYFPGLPTTGSLPFVGIRASDGRLYRIGKIVLGTNGIAIGSDAISGGKDTQAIGDQGFSIGDATIANGTNAVSTGKGTNAVGSGSLTTGDTTTAVGDNSVATGKDTIAKGTASFASGKSTVASGSNSIATGRDTIASGSNSMTAGSGSKADAENSVAFGKGTIAKTEEQVVIGRYNTADTQSLFVIGSGTSEADRKTIMKVDTTGARIDGSVTISGSSTFTNIGPAVFSGSIVQASTIATGIRSVALGNNSEASGDYAVAYGFQTTALGNYSFAGGANTIASGTYSVALGANTYAAQNASLAFGGYSRTNGLYSIAAGLRVTSSGLYQVVVGKDNIELSNTAAFIVGNGTNNDIRSNLLVASGDVVQITGSLNVNGNVIANSFTGSLLGNVIGTSSWASNAVTSSFASTASFVNTLRQNVTITGSLLVSNSIDSNNKYLIDNNGIASVRWNNYRLYNSDNNLVVHWGTGDLYSGSFTTSSISWTNRLLRNSAGITKVDWENNYLYDTSGSLSINWNGRTLSTPTTTIALDFSSDHVATFGVYAKQSYRNNVESEALSDTLLEHSGQAVRFAGQIHGSCVAGGLVYLDSGPLWRAVDQTADVSTRMLGIYLDSEYVLLEGDVVLDSIQSPDYGSTVYIRNTTTTGDMSTTIPTAGYVRVVGHCYHNNTSTAANWILKFRPSNDWYEI